MRGTNQTQERGTEAQQGRTAVAEPQAREYVSADVNIFETSDGFVLEAEMPGVNKDGLEVTLEGNLLTIVGRANRPALPGRMLHRESLSVDYRRVFELDPSVNGAGISARMDQGVLYLELPKAESVKPRKISVS